MSYSIRLATIDDLSGIIEIVGLVVPIMQNSGNFQWNDKYPAASDFERDITLRQLYVAAADTGRVLGVCAITKDQGKDYEAVWNTSEEAIVPHRLAVHPEGQGQGIAKAFMGYAEQLAKDCGIKSVRVDTNTQNAVTNGLFPKHGYHFVGEITLTGREGQLFNCYEKFV